jgi:hypothetical protein
MIHEAEKIRKYRLPAQNIGRTLFKPFVMGADIPIDMDLFDLGSTLASTIVLVLVARLTTSTSSSSS